MLTFHQSVPAVIEFLSATNFEHHLELRAALLAPAAFNIFIKATRFTNYR